MVSIRLLTVILLADVGIDTAIPPKFASVVAVTAMFAAVVSNVTADDATVENTAITATFRLEWLLLVVVPLLLCILLMRIVLLLIRPLRTSAATLAVSTAALLHRPCLTLRHRILWIWARPSVPSD